MTGWGGDAKKIREALMAVEIKGHDKAYGFRSKDLRSEKQDTLSALAISDPKAYEQERQICKQELKDTCNRLALALGNMYVRLGLENEKKALK